MATRHTLPALQPSDFTSAFPNSRKVYVEAGDVRVPMREIALSGGEPSLRVYDTSGPQGHDIREGLPLLRQPWIAARGGVTSEPRSLAITPARTPAMAGGLAARTATALRGSGPVTQLHYARRGTVTPEMEFIALREGFDAEFVRSEVARGTRHHPGQRQPSRARADDHRPSLRGEDQRQHRELGRQLVD